MSESSSVALDLGTREQTPVEDQEATPAVPRPMRRKRIAVGAYHVVANTFASQATTLKSVQAGQLPASVALGAIRGDHALDGFVSVAKTQGWEIVPLAFLYPALGGKLTDEAQSWASEQLLAPLRDAGPIEGVFLQLHGTAASDSIDDCEGDLLEAVRHLVGEAPVYASVDGHANVTSRMAAAADVLIGVKTNPHSDHSSVGNRLGELMAAMLDGTRKPVMARVQPAMAPALQKLYIAPGWPMEHLMRQARILCLGDARILDISIPGGFHLSEREETGISVLVTTDGEPTLARNVAETLSNACWAMRHAFHTDMVSVEDAVAEAMASDTAPVIIGDLSDSGGAGTPGDGTALLAELLRRGARSAVIGSIVDPDAVHKAIRVGVGGQLDLEVGGKVDQFHGEPVRISGRVRSLHDGVYRPGTAFNSKAVQRGLVAVVDCGGIEVILTSRQTIVFEPNHFRSLGIEPTERRILVCKAELHHRAGFAGIGRVFIDVDAPGLATQDLSRLPYTKIRRPVFPLDDM